MALVPERPISANPGLKILFHFCIYLYSYALLRETFCAIITESRSRDSHTTVFCKLESHVLRQEPCLRFGLILG